jgi:hypothetical protein
MALPSEYDTDQPAERPEQYGAAIYAAAVERARVASAAPLTTIFETMGLRAPSLAAGPLTAAEKFESDPEWREARAVFAAELDGYAGLSYQRQRTLVIGLMTDYETACLTRRTPRSIREYALQRAEYLNERNA